MKLHILELGSNCSNVGHLCINHVNLSQRPFNAILEHLHLFRNLQHLDLSFNDIKPALLNKLSANFKKLTALSTLILESNAIGQDDCKYLIKQLLRVPTFQQLSLSFCKLDDSCMESIALLFKRNKNITVLDLSGNDITIEGLKSMFDHLRFTFQTCDVEMLDLSYNPLGNEGLEYIASLISAGSLPKLKHLILKEIQAGSSSVEKLLHSLENEIHRNEMITLDLSGNMLLTSTATMKKKSSQSLSSAFQSVSDTLFSLQAQLVGDKSSVVVNPTLIKHSSKYTRKKSTSSSNNNKRKTKKALKKYSSKGPVIIDNKEVEGSSEAAHIAKILTNMVMAAHKLRTLRLFHSGLSARFLNRIQKLIVEKYSSSNVVHSTTANQEAVLDEVIDHDS
mmetsp:Transcript_30061/g.42911  ORF Transcript_30061/g.42911 Transcript_30061/m.42911 type:complete len:393 (+) Transcript_30061:180-1358(+)